MDSDYDFHVKKRPDKTYVSKRIGPPYAMRFASKVIDTPNNYHCWAARGADAVFARQIEA